MRVRGNTPEAAKTAQPDHSSGSKPSLSDYFQIPVNLYRPGDLIEEDLYFIYQGQFLLYRLKNLRWKIEDKKRLEDFGVVDLYIQCPTNQGHHEFLERHLGRILDEPEIPVDRKSKILYSTSTAIVSEIFTAPNTSDNVRRSMNFVNQSIDYITRDKNHFTQLMTLAQQDFSEYTHALHTCAYAVTLARDMGIKAYNQISALGVASLLHDIGKTKVRAEILSKETELSDDERKELEKHPQFSYEIVRDSRAAPELSELLILQHHERPSGKGYPKGISDIHVLTEMLILSDCFDSLTTDRIYRKGIPAIEALDHIRTTMQTDVRPEILKTFIKMLELKPKET